MSFVKLTSGFRFSVFLPLVLFACAAVSFAFSEGVFAFVSDLKTPAQPVPDQKKTNRRKNISTALFGPADDSFGGANGKLIFGYGPPDATFDIENGLIGAIEPEAGSTPTVLAATRNIEPSWSPDGQKIVFVSTRDGIDNDWVPDLTNREIYIMNADGTSQRRLTYNSLAEAQPVFSPDGTKILYVRSVDDNNLTDSAVYSMNLDGTNQTMLFDETCLLAVGKTGKSARRPNSSQYYPGIIGIDTPNYSPDMSKIVFGWDHDVFRYDVPSETCSLFANSTVGPTQPRYSPDGTKILYLGGGIVVTDADGNFIREIFAPNHWEAPVWSPDGTKIAYFGTTNSNFGSDQIWTYNLTNNTSQLVYSPPSGSTFFSGLSWGTPATQRPAISLAFSPSPSVLGGQPVTGIVQLDPALFPAGGTITLFTAALPNTVSLPQSSVFIPPGQTTGTFTVNTAPQTVFNAGDIGATYLGNTARATVSIRPPKSDLSVETVTAPATVTVGAAFGVSWTIKNLTTTDTYFGYRDNVYFSTDNQLDAGDPLLTSVNNSSLTGGAQRTVSRSVTVNQSHLPQNGTNYLIVVTNAAGTVDEGGATANNTAVKAIQISLPDVLAENISAPPEIEPNVNYNFSYALRNGGAGGTGVSFTNQLYFSDDQTIGDADDLLLDTFTQTAMTAGQTVTRNVTNKKIPTVPARSDGPGLIYVKVDTTNAVAEAGGEANNTAGAPTQFYYRVPDLQVTAAAAPAEVDSDTPLAIGWTTANAGTKNAGAITDKVYFSLDNQVGADVEIGSFPLAAGLAAGASADRIQNVTIPTSAVTQTGNYFVYVKTDATAAIDEGENENNNVRFQPVRVRRLLRPDLTVTNITAPATAFFDQTIQVQWTVTNGGQGPTNAPQWKDKVFLHTVETTSSSRLVAVAASVSAVGAGESYTASAVFKISRGYNGTYLFTIKTDADGALNEENTANNTLTRPIQIDIPPLPDLIVDSVQVPTDEAFAGQELLVGYAVKNQGTAAAGSWRDRIYLSRDTTLNTSQDRLIFTSDSDDRGSLGAGATRNLTSRSPIAGTINPTQYATMRLPGDVSGLWYVFVVTDYGNEVYEFNDENNNANYDRAEPGAPLNILVSPPDLVVSAAPTGPAAAAAGQSIPVGFTIKNQGAFDAAANLYHAVYLSTDLTVDANDTLLGSFRDENQFAPGAEHPVSTNFRLPDCLADGGYYLIAVADYDKRQFEFDPNFDAEANNASPAKAIQLATRPPDLQITNLQFPPVTSAGQSLAVSWTVTNTGSGAASGSWTDRLVLSSTNGEIAPVQLALIQHEGGLGAGGGYTTTANIVLPAYMEGDYFFSVVTDYRAAIPECGVADNNNAANSAPFTVANNLPDLVIETIGVQSAATAGDDLTVQWTGRNVNGPMPANSPSWTDSVYLSTDQALSGGDIYLGRGLNESVLAGGQAYQQQAAVHIGNVAAGNYYVLIVADAGQHIYEGASNTVPETNNVRASAPLALSAPAVDLQVGGVTVAAPYYSGSNLNVTWTVTNFGTTATLGTGWSDYVILSRDLILDASDPVLGYQNRNGALAGGASYTASGNFFVPNGLTGDYNILVVTDYKNKIIESSNANNTSPPFALVLTLTPPADLNVTAVSPPATINLGESAAFNWTVQNSGPNAVLGKWRDTVYLSRDTFWDSSDVLVGQRELDAQTTPVPAGGTYSTGTNLVVPPIAEGIYYVIVRTDAQNRIRESNEANNVSAAAAITTVTITELPVGTPLNTALGNGASKYLKLMPPPFETVLLSLTTDKPTRSNEVLTNFGSIVSRADFDFQGTRPGEGNQQNYIPETGDGPYYSLVRTDLIPESFAGSFDKAPQKNNGVNPPVEPQNITVKAEVLPFSVRQVSPSEAGNQGEATLSVEGAKFAAGATVRLVGADNSVITPRQFRNSSTKFAAIFDLKGKSAGDYDVVVTNPNNQSATLVNGFKIVNGGGYSLRQNINGPANIRFGARNLRYTFTAANDGLNDAFLVPLIISFPTNTGWALDKSNFMEYPSELLPPEASTPELSTVIEGRTYLMLLIPILRSRSEVTVKVDLSPPASGGIQIGFGVLPPFLEILKAGRQSSETNLSNLRQQVITAPAAADTHEACWVEFGRQLAFSLLTLIPGESCAAGLADFTTSVGDFLTGVTLALGTGQLTDAGIISSYGGLLLSMVYDVAKCSGEALPTVRLAYWSITAFNLIKQLLDCLAQQQLYDVRHIASLDPNEKIGPAGYGAENFVPASRPLLYRINFENVATATAPAQKIAIADALPPSLDIRTVRLREIGFKQYRYLVPDNQSFYQARVELGDDLNNLKADIVAGVDLIGGKIFWNLTAIDPQTGEPLSDPALGILPPDNENQDGEGYVEFTVEAKPEFPNRTVIANSATIIFDENEPIVTNPTANLLDSVVPASAVAPLAATTASPAFTVSWSGSDDADGSGFKGYDVYYSENGGAYFPLLTGTTATSTTFAGKYGKSYRFYSIAADNAGNVERPPAMPDAETRVLGGVTEADVAPRPNGLDGQISVADVTQIRRFAAGLDTDFLYNEFQRADVSPLEGGGDGALSTADVIQSRRFAAGLDPKAAAAGPNEAAPFGAKSNARTESPSSARELRPVRIIRNGNKITVGIELEAQGDEVGAGFTLDFDPAVLSNPTGVVLGSDAGGAVLTVNDGQAAQGKLGIIIDRSPTDPFTAGIRQILRIDFDVAPGNPPTATLGFGDSPVLSEIVDGGANALTTGFSARTIQLATPTAAGVSVAGRVLSSDGRPVVRANVTMTDQNGRSRTTTTNTFGNFRFSDIPAGEIFSVGVKAKGFVFNPRILTVDDDISDLILTADSR